MLVNKIYFDHLPGGGNGKKATVYSGGAEGRGRSMTLPNCGHEV